MSACVKGLRRQEPGAFRIARPSVGSATPTSTAGALRRSPLGGCFGWPLICIVFAGARHGSSSRRRPHARGAHAKRALGRRKRGRLGRRERGQRHMPSPLSVVPCARPVVGGPNRDGPSALRPTSNLRAEVRLLPGPLRREVLMRTSRRSSSPSSEPRPPCRARRRS